MADRRTDCPDQYFANNINIWRQESFMIKLIKNGPD